MNSLWLGLLANTAVVAVIISIWSNLRLPELDRIEPYRAWGFGLLFGVGAIGVMLIPFRTETGFYIDLRTTMIGISAFIGGPVAGVLAACMALAYRVWLGGGVSLIIGSCVIALALGVGCAAHYLRRDDFPTVKDSLAFSLALSIGAITPAMFLDLGLPTIWDVLLPIVILVFTTSLTACLAIGNELRRRDAEQRNYMYRRLIDILPEALNIKDLQGRFIMANPATASLMHVESVQHLIGKSDADFYPPDVAKAFRLDEERALKQGAPMVEEQQLLHLDGQRAHLSTLKAPFTDRRGRTIGLITHNRDITDRKRLETALAQSDRRAAEALSNISDGLVMFDKDLTLVFCNERYRSMFAATADLRVPGTSAAAILYGSIARGELVGIPPEQVSNWVDGALSRLRKSGTVQFPLADGRWIESRTRPTEDGSCFVICSDITDSKRHELALQDLNEKLAVLAETDGLTGLLNRRAFDALLAQEVQGLVDRESSLALVMVDVDHFKRFNDTYGHGAGDSCLKMVADCLRASARRSTDRAARYGGEEMALILPGADGKSALAIAEEFCERLRDLRIPHAGSQKNIVTASVGVFCILDGSRYLSAERIIVHADEALYRAKQDGRDCVRVWEPGRLRVVQ